MNMPVFAADADTVIATIVALITIVGWIINLVSNKNQKGPPVANRPRPAARPRDERLQDEINIFIQDAGGQRSRPAASRPTASAGSAARPAASRPPAAAQGKRQ